MSDNSTELSNNTVEPEYEVHTYRVLSYRHNVREAPFRDAPVIRLLKQDEEVLGKPSTLNFGWIEIEGGFILDKSLEVI